MARKKWNDQKYGAPLFCAAWPQGRFLLVAGGGGKKGCGIPNRLAKAHLHLQCRRRTLITLHIIAAFDPIILGSRWTCDLAIWSFCVRIIAAQHTNGKLSEQAGSFDTADAALRMALTPKGNALVVVLGNGSLQRFDLEQRPGACPMLTPATGAVYGKWLLYLY